MNYQSLLEIPGIGDYTSSAISAILNDEKCAVVDGNIKRILTRVFMLNNDDKLYDKKIRYISTYLTPNKKWKLLSIFDGFSKFCLQSKKPRLQNMSN